jgi:hypothetical protein
MVYLYIIKNNKMTTRLNKGKHVSRRKINGNPINQGWKKNSAI